MAELKALLFCQFWKIESALPVFATDRPADRSDGTA